MKDGSPSLQNEALFRLISDHLTARRQVQPEDVYKLLYQGVFAGEHLLTSLEHARLRFFDEWEQTDPNGSEPLLEPVSIDGEVVRVNLGRCRAENLPADAVWLAFSQSGRLQGTKDELQRLLDGFYELCACGRLPFDAVQVRCLIDDLLRQNQPPLHHSSAYREANRPAYRVVLKREFQSALDSTVNSEYWK